jgi:hypothetical protein
MEYSVTVVFNERGYWSKAYTYKSKVICERGDIVIVPTNDFYSVGKVVSFQENPIFDSKINYKFIVQKFKP